MTLTKNQLVTALCWLSVALQAALTIIGFATGTWGMGLFFGVHLALNLMATKSLRNDEIAEERIKRLLGHNPQLHKKKLPPP